MEDERIVVDASVALKWFHPEAGSEAAVRILRRIERRELVAFAPDLILYEVANVWVRGMGKEATEVATILDSLQELSRDLVESTTDLLAEAAVFAKEHRGVSVYDAIYVALAIRESAIVLTADQKLKRRVGDSLARLL